MNKLKPRYFFFRHQNIRIAYLDTGKINQEVVVLLHGFTMNATSNWLKTNWVSKLVSNHYRVIAIDARGHGLSDKPHDSKYYPAKVMATDVIYLLKKLKINSASLIGFSMGARVATFVATSHPNLIKKLVIGGMGENLILGRNDSEEIAKGLTDPKDQSISKSARRFRLIAYYQQNDLKALACCILATRQKITIQALQQIKATTKIIVGDQDEIAGSAKNLQKYILGSQVTIIENCNHFNAIYSESFQQAAIDFICS